MTPDDLRLIEDYLPIEAIGRENTASKGHLNTLHLWWARRPLRACRAAVYGALVSADRWVKDITLKNPPVDPQRSAAMKAGTKRGLNRRAAAEFVTKLCEHPPQPRLVQQAHQQIAHAHCGEGAGGQKPRVLDLFSGGGAIPLEAIRLGCDVYANELNPVAHMIELCSLVYPQQYGAPDKGVGGATGDCNAKGQTTWGGLAAEVEHWGNVVFEIVRREIGDLYPLIPDAAYGGKKPPKPAPTLFKTAGKSEVIPAGFLVPVAYLWTRTVPCKNPGCGAQVPMLRQTW